jgi:plastocyanin
MLEEIWTGFLDLTSQFVMPDWGGLVALLPIGIFALVLLVVLAQFRRLAVAPRARRGKFRQEPRTPAGVHMPGPSFRPLLASLGVALLFAGLVFGGWILAVGIVALIVSLLGWLIDARREYVKVEEADRTGHLENLPDPRMPSTIFAVFAVLVVGAVLLQTGVLPPGTASGNEAGGSAEPPAAASGEPPAIPPGSGEPGASGAPGGPAPEADAVVTARGVAFIETEFTAPADQPFRLAFVNEDAGVPHNVALHEGSPTGPEAWRGEIFNGVETRVYEVDALPAGTYGFICSVHPAMTGTATLE